MEGRDVAEVVREAESLGLDDLDRARFILDRGVTLDEYRRFAWRRTAVHVLRWLLAAVACGLLGEVVGRVAGGR